jgi:hypothetical protein
MNRLPSYLNCVGQDEGKKNHIYWKWRFVNRGGHKLYLAMIYLYTYAVFWHFDKLAQTAFLKNVFYLIKEI